MTPPDPSDPTNLEKQFYFASLSSRGGAVIGCSFHTGTGKVGKQLPKILTSPDWNRTKPGFVPYRIEIGQVSDMLGRQHFLFFKTANATQGGQPHDNFVFRNVRLYEEGSPDPGPTTFDPTKFSVRPQRHFIRKTGSSAAAPNPIAPGTVMVEDNGHAVHFLNALTVNYPLNYTITANTILAFDLNLIECVPGRGHGIGLSPDVSKTPKDDALHYLDFMRGAVGRDPAAGVQDPAHGAYPYPTYEPNTLYTDTTALPPTEGSHGKSSKEELKLLWWPGFYGLKISENGKLLFACNNADNRLEVRDISTDGRAIAKIPIDYPMFVTLAPEGAAGAVQGTRYVYVDSPKAGLVRIAWNLSGNTFGKPETITAASEFAYPRGLVDGQGQHRLGEKETYFWPRPWNTSAPAQNDARWKSTASYDYAAGVYTNGYGSHNEINVLHQRQILFLKSESLFVISDTLTPQDNREHGYDALFHLDAEEATVDASTKAVRSANTNAANVLIVPVVADGLEASLVKGKTDEPVQGWSNSPWRPIPTAVFHKTGKGMMHFNFVLEPLAKGASARVVGVERTDEGVRIKFADKSGLYVHFGEEPLIKYFSPR